VALTQEKVLRMRATLTDEQKKRIGKIIADWREKPGPLLPVLQAVQNEVGYLSEEVLITIASGLDLPLSKVYGVATFYTLFNTKPKARHIIRLCESAPCHVEGAGEILAALERALGVKVGESTPDGLFTLETASCLGVCGVAPAIMIDDEVYGNLTPRDIDWILARYREEDQNQ